MEALKVVRGTALPLNRSDVDTDQIIPSSWLKRVERTGFGEGLFSTWREDPDFVLNDARYSGATILIAGPNFGTGSSREHAVWAVQQYGFRAVISPRFGDIFRNNSAKCGLVPVVVDTEFGKALLAAVTDDPSLEVVVDIEQLRVEAPAAALAMSFSLEAAVQERFLNGLDDIELTLRHSAAIAEYEAGRPSWLPVTTK